MRNSDQITIGKAQPTLGYSYFLVLKTVQSNDKFTQDPIKKQLSFGQEQSSFIFIFDIQFYPG